LRRVQRPRPTRNQARSRHLRGNLGRVEQWADELARRGRPGGIVFVSDAFPAFVFEFGESIVHGLNLEADFDRTNRINGICSDNERALLQQLDKVVQAEEVRSQILPIVTRVREDLARKPDALMTWEPIGLETFGENLPPAIQSGWIFVPRAGADTGAEGHPNSHQRMMTFTGTGDMKIDAKGTTKWRPNLRSRGVRTFW